MLKKYKLIQLVKIKNGKDHKFLADGNIPVFGSGGLMRYVNEHIYDKASILLPRKGSLHNIQYADKPFWTVDTLYYTEINEELIVPYFLYYYLKGLNLENLNTGTGVPSMTFNSYYDLELQLPEIEIQKLISDILDKIDKKISVNNQLNDNLPQRKTTILRKLDHSSASVEASREAA
ncbi:restriction endonuclease subunit S [Chryseobacterium koreense]|uniref:restriction endonuclease subunit S n=1 Tax=Chryseobacterium koreense TaxID=232216 RepID=UPI0026F01159|nr:restriction endonuclease subunit S [Chryseobacterium koreense]